MAIAVVAVVALSWMETFQLQKWWIFLSIWPVWSKTSLKRNEKSKSFCEGVRETDGNEGGWVVGGKKGGFKKVSYPVYFEVYNRLALGIILKISDLLFLLLLLLMKKEEENWGYVDKYQCTLFVNFTSSIGVAANNFLTFVSFFFF